MANLAAGAAGEPDSPRVDEIAEVAVEPPAQLAKRPQGHVLVSIL